ncbi:putative protein phosphatase 2C 40 [Zea mays]|uniref:protein-serine/threonine phosphatase n=1 Tax=Zea mays TaxID=4577 RepID=A0A3L6EE38_MAIZE|nr:putative protein phosphatase 2C 40 [Zea mays]
MTAYDDDQFATEKDVKQLSTYFSLSYLDYCVAEVAALTVVVWAQTHFGMATAAGIARRDNSTPRAMPIRLLHAASLATCWPGDLCLSRSIGDQDVGEFIIPVPYVKQIKLSNVGGRLIISSDGVWDALTAELAFKCARGLPPEAAAEQIVKEAVEAKGLRDDTTCIFIDIISPEKPKRTIQSQRTPGKGLVLLKNFFFKENSI